jgi:uncharacterized protein
MTNRPAPVITDRTAPFWTGGARGELCIERCRACGWWQHPPRPRCARCHGADVGPEPVSGAGTVWSYTVSRTSWGGLDAPYVVAEVELDEQPGLRLVTAIVDCDDVTIGLRVRVRFEQAGEAWVPVFAP